jgi:subtilisin family serine protease
VLDAWGTGAFSDVIAGIEWCVDTAQAEVINMSLGGGAFSEICDESDPTGTASAVNAAAANGVLVVSSAGNEKNHNAVGTPACASGSMAVGATYDANVGRMRFLDCTDRKTRRDRITCFSNRWDFLDVVAPGCVIHSADREIADIVVGMCGTSQASPHVAGLAALVMASNPGLSTDEIRECINLTAKDLGDSGFDRTYGHGRIQAIEAVACNTSCVPMEEPEVSCADGLDNDCDALVDEDDPDCEGGPVCAGNKAPCSANEECCSSKCVRGRCRGN